MKYSSAQIKGKIKNVALKNNADPRILIRHYMMERFLERLSISEYRNNFVIKGGILITSLIGIKLRSTMDIDTSIRNYNLDENNVKRIIDNIINITIDDDVKFRIISIEKIMDKFEYSGIRVSLQASIEKIITPIKIDISTGDIITPREIEYEYGLMLEDRNIKILAYNLETIIAEKLQSILSKGLGNTRMRDYYDVYTIMNVYRFKINYTTLKQAYIATCSKRDSLGLLGSENKIISLISDNDALIQSWKEYTHKYEYAKDISFVAIIDIIKDIVKFCA